MSEPTLDRFHGRTLANKLATALAVLRIVASGGAALDDPLAVHVPEAAAAVDGNDFGSQRAQGLEGADDAGGFVAGGTKTTVVNGTGGPSPGTIDDGITAQVYHPWIVAHSVRPSSRKCASVAVQLLSHSPWLAIKA